jgi:signal transduction histidine kinase
MDPSLRQTAGINTRLAVRYVRARAGEEGVRDMLRLAGETRSAEELEDERTWSTYDQMILLLESAARVLGDPHVSRHMGETAVSAQVGAGLKVLLRALGSPGQVLRHIAQTAPKFMTVCTMEASEVGPTQAVITYRLHDGFRPNRLDCELNIGLLTQVSVLFGLPPASVEHPECQVRGAERCVYRLRWQERSRLPWRRRRLEVEHLRNQLATLTERTEALQHTIADLASPADVDTVLARIATRAGEALGAQRYLLAVRPTPDSQVRVHHDGFSSEEAERCADELLARDPGREDPSRLVVDVVSARRHYGRLAAFYPEGLQFFPEERMLLAAYGRHAAVALDAATALEEARQRGTTAGVLLELTQSLARATTPSEVADRLAAAVPHLVGADRACVLLHDPESGDVTVGGRRGYSAEQARSLSELVKHRSDPLRPTGPALDATPVYHSAETADPKMAMMLRSLGSAGILVVPIVWREGLLGVVTADVLATQPSLQETPLLQERMRGLADAAATALENARLLAREREALERVRQANRLKSEFLAMVSHELRTPLAVIVGGVKTLKNQGHRMTEQDREQLVEAVVHRSEQLRGLVEDLLQTTRELKLQLAIVDLSEVVAEAVAEMGAAEPGLRISCDAPGPVPVVADVNRIRQVVDNLLTNAVKYAPGSWVRVEARTEAEVAVLTVSDQGPGMNEEQAARAFEPFYQGGQPTGSGVGLGLHITRRIVEAHGGSIRIESHPGEGTSIRLALPAAARAGALSS